MGDLTFGEPLDMLDSSDYNPWVAAMFAGFHYGTYLHCIRYYPTLEKALLRLVPKSTMKKKKLHDEFSHLRVDRRLEKEDARPDIWGLVLERDEEHSLTREEMYANSNIFMLAGTETTATLLSGLTYYLLTSPEKLAQLTSEIRDAFTNDSEITIEKLQALKYLNACVEEGLRIYPPVANGLPRIVSPGGTMIGGRHVPAGVGLKLERRRWRRSLKLILNRRKSSLPISQRTAIRTTSRSHTRSYRNAGCRRTRSSRKTRSMPCSLSRQGQESASGRSKWRDGARSHV